MSKKSKQNKNKNLLHKNCVNHEHSSYYEKYKHFTNKIMKLVSSVMLLRKNRDKLYFAMQQKFKKN